MTTPLVGQTGAGAAFQPMTCTFSTSSGTISATNAISTSGLLLCFYSTGTLPTGISAGTGYGIYSGSLTTSAFALQTSMGSGVELNASGYASVGSGTIKAYGLSGTYSSNQSYVNTTGYVASVSGIATTMTTYLVGITANVYVNMAIYSGTGTGATLLGYGTAWVQEASLSTTGPTAVTVTLNTSVTITAGSTYTLVASYGPNSYGAQCQGSQTGGGMNYISNGTGTGFLTTGVIPSAGYPSTLGTVGSAGSSELSEIVLYASGFTPALPGLLSSAQDLSFLGRH